MQRIGHVGQKTRTRRFDEGNFRGYTDYLIESEPGARPAPQAFLVHQVPEWTLPPHFHLEEQFQVVTGGSGTLGKHAIAPITVHYTSRETGYGPLISGSDGLDYLSLRAVTDPGAWYMPESRGKMRPGLRKRQSTIGPITVGSLDASLDPASGGIEVLSAPDEHGLAIWLIRLAANASMSAPPHAMGGGRFHVVVGGSMNATPECLGYGAVVWRDAEDAPLDMQAGPQGLAMLVMQFPMQALDAEPRQMDGT